MPPWAAPVWDRVGESLVRTAGRTGVEDSSAARMPAPPAPTMTTSYWCVCMVFRTFPVSLRLALRQRRGGVDARVEREDDEGAQHEGEHGAEGQQRLQDEAGGGPPPGGGGGRAGGRGAPGGRGAQHPHDPPV